MHSDATYSTHHRWSVNFSSNADPKHSASALVPHISSGDGWVINFSGMGITSGAIRNNQMPRTVNTFFGLDISALLRARR